MPFHACRCIQLSTQSPQGGHLDCQDLPVLYKEQQIHNTHIHKHKIKLHRVAIMDSQDSAVVYEEQLMPWVASTTLQATQVCAC
jgi:hypothetical protein